MLASANSFKADFTNKPKVTDDLSHFFEEVYTCHKHDFIIGYKVVIDVKISEIFLFIVNIFL